MKLPAIATMQFVTGRARARLPAVFAGIFPTIPASDQIALHLRARRRRFRAIAIVLTPSTTSVHEARGIGVLVVTYRTLLHAGVDRSIIIENIEPPNKASTFVPIASYHLEICLSYVIEAGY